MSTPVDASRRAFLRGMTPQNAAQRDAWDEVEARAARFGIVPGSYIDPHGIVHPPSGEFVTDPYIGELILVAFNYAPKYYAFCNGQFLPINQNQALFALLGTTFGGDGQTNFALPDLRGRTLVGKEQGPGLSLRTLGERAGTETVTLAASNLPQHVHGVPTSATATATTPANGYYAPAGANAYASVASTPVMATGSTGGGQAHSNMPPYLVLNWCIALTGLFPSRN